MKILFVLHLFSHTRHFHTVFQELIARGHSLEVVGLNKIRGQGPTIREPAHAKHIQPIVYSRLPDPRSDFWGGYAEAFRASRNMLIYAHPRFKNATVFRERAAGYADPFLRGLAPEDGRAPPAWLTWFYRAAETAIPPDPAVEALLAEKRPDVTLVSPLISPEMIMLHEFVKAANKLGIPIGFPVFSWDNLTTKGTVHDLPDRIFVWNETQKREAIEFHGLPEARVEALGAWRFDEFLAFKPTIDRASFCELHGFDPNERIVLYLGSSPIIAPTEARFVQEWVDAVRNSSDASVRRANLLIRPHPRNIKAWQSDTGLAQHPCVSVEDIQGLSLFETQGLYNDIFHSDAVLGLVTSGMIEAALLRKPVHTVLTSLAGEGQTGTVHFEYLTTAGGGLLHVARSTEEHLSLLGSHLQRPFGTPDERAENFVRAFVDPPDRSTTSTKTLADAIEGLAAIRKTPRRDRVSSQVGERLFRAALGAGLLPVRRAKPEPDAQ